jgi:hypothetical protein
MQAADEFSRSLAVPPSDDVRDLRLRDQYPRLTLVHAPVYASWLKQVEIYFSTARFYPRTTIPSLEALAERLLDFQYYWKSAAQPFEWKFTRQESCQTASKTRK